VKLRAVNGGGTGAASATTNATPRTVAGAPVVSAVTSLDSSLNFTVTAPARNGGSTITGYEWTINDGSTWNSVASLLGGVLVEGLTNGQEYTFKIRARNSVGVGAPSSVLSGTPAVVPDAPAFDSVIGRNGKLIFKLAAGVSNGGAAISGIQYRTSDADEWSSVDYSTVTSSYVADGLNNGQTYPLEVRLVNRLGAGDSAIHDATPMPEVASSPSLSGLVPENGKLTMNVTAPTNDGGAGVTGYEYSTDAGSVWRAATLSGSSLTVSGLVNGTTYNVIVRAVNSAGSGAASAPLSGTPIPTAPYAPTITSLVSADGSLLINYSAPISDGGAIITGYEYSIDAGGTWQPATSAVGFPTQLQISGLTNGTSYLVQIRAKNAVGVSRGSARMAGLVGPTSGALNLTAINPYMASANAVFVVPTTMKNGAWANTWYQYSIDGGLTWSANVRSLSTAALAAEGKAYINISHLSNGMSYSVAIRANFSQKIRGVVASAPGQASRVLTVVPRTVASAPRITQVSTSGGAMTIYFEAPVSNGGSAITNYSYCFGANKWVLVKPGSSLSPIVISGLNVGRVYTVRIVAINAAGAGTASGPSAIVIKG
jgi:titin